MLGNKQNVFDDFVSAAEYLVQNNYTNPSRSVQCALFQGLIQVWQGLSWVLRRKKLLKISY